MNYDNFTKEQIVSILKDTLEYSSKLREEIERLKEQLNDEIDDGLKQSEIMVKQHNEIERLNNIVNNLDKLIEQYSKNDYYYKYNGKYLKSEIINDLKELKGSDKDE